MMGPREVSSQTTVTEIGHIASRLTGVQSRRLTKTNGPESCPLILQEQDKCVIGSIAEGGRCELMLIIL